MSEKPRSTEDRKNELQKRTKCPLADGRLFIFVQAMDPYNRHRIVLECPAKRQVVKDATQWKIEEDEIERLCCSPDYASMCEWYKATRGGK
jgi:hypothetical protein